MERYTTQSTSRQSGRLLDPIVICESETTRKVVYVDFNDVKTDKGETVGITIVHQRKGLKDCWEDVASQPLSSLKAGEATKMILNSESTRKLYDELGILYKIMNEVGIQGGTTELTVTRADEMLRVDGDRRIIIEQMLKEDYDQELWNALIEKKPDLATRLSLANIQTNRMAVLEKYERNLEANNHEESFWQSFFEENTWIFGYGLNYQFLHLLTEQPSYGGGSVFGAGNQKGDFLMRTSAEAKFTVLVEIKTPASMLYEYRRDGHPKKVRNGVWELGSELIRAISQIQVNTRTWKLEAQNNTNNVRLLDNKHIYTVEPKGILVYGNTKEITEDVEMVACFESFRRNTINPEIVTFDELYQRAKYIVGSKNASLEARRAEDDDLPF